MSIVSTIEREMSYPNAFTLFYLFILKVRAQLVQQQHAAAAAVQAAQAQAAQMGASAQVRALEPVSSVTGLWQVHAKDEHGDGFLMAFWWGLIGHPYIKEIWAFMLFSFCLDSEAGFRWQPLCACSLSLVGKIVACSYTGMHNKTAYCGHTAVWLLVPGVYHLFLLSFPRKLLCCLNWFLYCQSLPALLTHMCSTFHLHVPSIKSSIDNEIFPCSPFIPFIFHTSSEWNGL